MHLRMGNMSPGEFAEAVDTEFTDDELSILREHHSGHARLEGAEDWHIFTDPAIVISVGSVGNKAMEVFAAADARKTFNRPVQVVLDQAWKKEK